MTSRNPPPPTGEPESAAAIDAAAAAWAARVDAGALSARDRKALEDWAAADPRRAGAYARALAVSAHLDLQRADTPTDMGSFPASSRRRLIVGGGMLAAASMVGAAVSATVMLQGRLATRKGDISRSPLADGSAVTLNTDSAVKPGFDRRLRRIALLRGEALFDVAKDPARPFVVVAGPVRVRAVGTSFTVRVFDDGQVGVLVREGVVEVWRSGEDRPLRLPAQTEARVSRAGPLQARPVSAAATDRATAWREGMIDLYGLTLAEAAAEFARYSDRRIEIDDPAVARLKVTGLFSANDPEGFARTAAVSLGLAAEAGAGGVRLRRGAAS